MKHINNFLNKFYRTKSEKPHLHKKKKGLDINKNAV